MAGPSQVREAPEVEATIDRLMSHRGVRGVLILDNASGRVIRFAGSALEASTTAGIAPNVEAEAGQNDAANDSAPNTQNVVLNENVQRYAKAAKSIVQSSSYSLAGLDDEDTLRFLRLRTKKFEMLITLGDVGYGCVELQS